MISKTHVEFSRCSASPELNNVLSHHPSLAIDIHNARMLVSRGMATNQAIDRVRLNGPITTSRESFEDNECIVESLSNCLGKIAAGKCTEYPKN